jgi:hypothetical protein
VKGMNKYGSNNFKRRTTKQNHTRRQVSAR